MSGRNAMAWMLAAAMVLALTGLASAVEEKKPEAVPLPGEDPKDQKVLEQLDTIKVTFEFNEQPFVEAIDFLQTLAKLNIVADKAKLKDAATVTLKLKDAPLSTALKLLTAQVDLTYGVRDGVILISDAEGLKRPPVRAMYDVADLLKPRAGLKAKEPDEALNDLIETIKQTIAPGNWDEGSGNAIRGIDGTIIVTHVPDVHREVRKFLAELRKVREGDAKR